MNTELTARLERIKEELQDTLTAYDAAGATDTKHYKTARSLRVAIKHFEQASTMIYQIGPAKKALTDICDKWEGQSK